MKSDTDVLSLNSLQFSRFKHTQSDGHLVESSETVCSSITEGKAIRETFRLASFRKCKIAVRPYELAVAGFYYVGPGDRVRCFSCGACVQSWKPNDNVKSSNWHTSDCKHYKREDTRNIAIGAPDNFSSISSPVSTGTTSHVSQSSELKTNSQDLLRNHSVPWFAVIFEPTHQKLLRSLSLNKEADRRRSFVGDWPEELRELTNSLAKTGFFYLGNLDRTQCFSCGAVQKSWTPSDDVHKIHGAWFKECKMIRGEEDRNIPLTEQPLPMDVTSFLSRAEISPGMGLGSSDTSLPTSVEANIYDSPPDVEQPFDVLSTPPSSFQYQFSDDMVRAPPVSKSWDGPLSENIEFKTTNKRKPDPEKDPILVDPGPSASLDSRLSDRLPSLSRFGRGGDAASNSPASNRPREPVAPPGFFLSGSVTTRETAFSQSSFDVNTSSENQPPTQIPKTSGSPTVVSPSSGSLPPDDHLLVPSYPPALNSSSIFQFSSSEGLTFQENLPTRSVEELSQLHIPPTLFQESSIPWFQESTSKHQQESSGSLKAPLPPSELDVDDSFMDPNEKLLLQDMYPCQNPQNREMVFLSQRLSSFRLPWPENDSISSITEVAAAGFYYLGTSDHVRCWYCGVEAHKWALHHPAWLIHARLYPSCQYLLRNRGSEFVETILTTSQSRPLSRASTNESIALSLSESHLSFGSEISFAEPVESGPNRLPTPPIVDPRVEAEFKKEELRRGMESPMVGQAMSMGFRRSHIRQVMTKQIDEHDCRYQSLEALLDGLIFTPENLIDLVSSDDDDDQNNRQPAPDTREENALEDLDDDINLYEGATAPDRTVEANQRSSTVQFESIQPLPSISTGRSRAEDKEAELRRLQDEKRCKICLDHDATLVFVPCGHICACEQCCRSLRQCPLCRAKIDKAYKTYAS